MQADRYILGAKLKAFRREAGLSLSQASGQAGMTGAFISLVERGKCGISFQKLHTLLTVYGKTLSDLSAPAVPGDVVNLNSAIEAASEDGVTIYGLAALKSGAALGGFQLVFAPHARHDEPVRDGAEYVLVLEGTFDLFLGDPSGSAPEIRHLVKGDTTVYSAGRVHSLRNTGDSFGAVLAVEAPFHPPDGNTD